ncbi:hypothetical protein SNEBB_000836 [Seison nebaliae]|nr:hypothetical protein SNEBB_000836 [Seison nebaliae]
MTNVKSPNFYERLNCNEYSTIEQIQTEFRRKAVDCHPDRSNKNPDAKQFQELEEAKRILCDEKTRPIYDRWLSNPINVPWSDFLKQSGNFSSSFHFAYTKPPAAIDIRGMDESVESIVQTDNDSIITFNDHRYQWQRSNSDIRRKFRRYQI